MPSTLGRNPDPSSLNTVPTVRMPTKTFRGETEFQVGGVTFHLIEAPGETNDHLMVWIPSLEVLAVGDNFIRGFPEVHHVRGAPLREPGQWVATLDAMRALNPKHVISARHEPVSGRESVRAALIDYRDALQWLRNETLRAINRGDSIDSAAETITLPKHLAESPFLTEDTGCVERAVRAIYTSYVGWFDERPEALFPSDQESIAQREIRMMGGHEAVLVAARKAGQDGDHRWALHLLAKLRDDSAEPDAWREQYATTLKALAGEVSDSSGASYLVSAANELTSKAQAPELKKCPDDETIQQIPLETILDMMCLRIKTDRVLDVHESVVVYITDEDRQFNVTIRHGIAEVDEGEPLPEMPKPEAILVTDGLTFRKMCMGILSPVAAVAIGDLKIRGSRLAAMRFSRRFECKQLYEKPETSETVRLSASDKGRTSGAR
jgi:alkyl sulfatase BDS1-like metallo-beta-lactamase superfamily hydrolase